MMMKIFCVMLALSLISLAGRAQTVFGVEAGTAFSHPQVTAAGESLDGELVMGAAAGLYARFPLGQLLFVHPALHFVDKGSKDRGTGERFSLHYLSLPVDIMWMHSGSGWFAGAGPYAGYGVGGSHRGGAADWNESPFGEQGDLKRLDAGGHLILGYELPGGLNLSVSTEQGLLNLRRGGDRHHRFRNNSYLLALGYTFGR